MLQFTATWPGVGQAGCRETECGKGFDADHQRSDRLLFGHNLLALYPAQKLLAAAALLLINVLRPFWKKFSEGLADLAVRLIEYKMRRRWPELFKDEAEIAPKKSIEVENATGPQQRVRRRKHRRRH